MQSTHKELLKRWANAGKRREFLLNYTEWGIWLQIPELGLTYYRYELPKDGGKILVMTYQRPNPYQYNDEGPIQTCSTYYLWSGEYFIPNAASEYSITDHLKKLKVELQKESRTETD
jgi:hypothetical protein